MDYPLRKTSISRREWRDLTEQLPLLCVGDTIGLADDSTVAFFEQTDRDPMVAVVPGSSFDPATSSAIVGPCLSGTRYGKKTFLKGKVEGPVKRIKITSVNMNHLIGVQVA